MALYAASAPAAVSGSRSRTVGMPSTGAGMNSRVRRMKTTLIRALCGLVPLAGLWWAGHIGLWTAGVPAAEKMLERRLLKLIF